MTIEWIRYGKPSVLGIVTGMVAGLGTITPASGFVSPASALLIGLLSGVICYVATQTIKRQLRIDDSLDVFPVHGVGGVIGTVFAGVFVATEYGGVGLADGITLSQQVGIQALGVVATAAWCAVMTFAIFKVLDVTLGLRVGAEVETEGLDLGDHGERAYTL
jgi:Amt family ammonium transporter